MNRFSLARLVCLCSFLAAASVHAQPKGDVFSSQGQYDPFAVGSAHRWYDKHSTEAKEKSSHCLSILEEAKAYQDKALALYEEAKQPGNSRRQSELVKQANEQIRLRGERLRAFTDCVNQALRQTGPPSDQFASSGDGTPNGRVQTESPPAPDPSDGGSKGIKRFPEKPAIPRDKSQPTAIESAADDCFAASVPNYRGPDWVRYNRKAPKTKPVGQVQPLFDTLGLAADQALDLDEAVYGAWQDRELMRDYLIGWLSHCLTERKVVLKQDPRIPYRRHMEARAPSDLQTRKRITSRFEEFGYGYRSYPLPPFWDHDMAGPPSPTR
ncbi:MAG: hypothetical protein GDA67_01965 [Nitrospira sp. CR1.3]|nr:hypothetical protein [Nitrospira sp. CR1.3]